MTLPGEVASTPSKDANLDDTAAIRLPKDDFRVQAEIQALWWRTYSPPRWLLGAAGLSGRVKTRDLMGAAPEAVRAAIELELGGCESEFRPWALLLVAPRSSLEVDGWRGVGGAVESSVMEDGAVEGGSSSSSSFSPLSSSSLPLEHDLRVEDSSRKIANGTKSKPGLQDDTKTELTSDGDLSTETQTSLETKVDTPAPTFQVLTPRDSSETTPSATSSVITSPAPHSGLQSPSKQSPAAPILHTSWTRLYLAPRHLGLDDLDIPTEGVRGTFTRVWGRRGLEVWRVACSGEEQRRARG